MNYWYMEWKVNQDKDSAEFEYAVIINHDKPNYYKFFYCRDDVMDFFREKTEANIIYVNNVKCADYLFKGLLEEDEWTNGLPDILLNIFKKDKVSDEEDKKKSRRIIQFRNFTKLENRECSIEEMQRVIANHAKKEGSINKVPITISTYNRIILRKCNRHDRKYMRMFKKNHLNAFSYSMIHKAKHGGWCALNPKWVEKIVMNVWHFDFRSHYPTQLRKHMFPMGKPFMTNDSIEKIVFQDETYTYFVKISFANVKPKKDKICMIKEEWIEFEKIRGEKRGVLYLTNIDLKWFLRHYMVCDLKIEAQMCMKNYYLTKDQIKVIDDAFIEKYKAKAELELHRGTPEESWYQFLYDQAKVRLNSIYGEYAKDPLKYYDTTSHTISEGLKEFYNGRYNTVMYSIGVMVTSYARDELFEFIELIGYDNVIYGDTDSLFFIGGQDIYDKVMAKNEELRKTAPYAEYMGNKFYYDVFEYEEKLDFFKALHAKCYATVKDGKFKTKIAGIPDSVNGVTREQEIGGGLLKFNTGMKFKICTPTIIEKCPGGYIERKLKEVEIGNEKEHGKLLKKLLYNVA